MTVVLTYHFTSRKYKLSNMHNVNKIQQIKMAIKIRELSVAFPHCKIIMYCRYISKGKTSMFTQQRMN
jgi:hypothetical protein